MISRVSHLLPILAVVLIIGCGPEVSEEDLGRIVFEVPEIPAGYEPYELPDLTGAGEESEQPGDAVAASDEDSDQPGEPTEGTDAMQSTEDSAPSPESAGEPSDTIPPDATAPAGE